MSAIAAHVDSTSGKKRKVKAETVAAQTDSASHASDPPSVVPGGATNGDYSATDSPYIKELARQIRNVHKKLAASAKADAVLLENKGKDIEQLVAEKKLNNDQKAQLQKKPQLQAQAAQLEEQLSQYRSFVREHEERANKEKASLIEAHEAEIARIKEEAETKAEAQEGQSKTLENGLKVVSDFLHAAASKRNLLLDESIDERRAFEGALLLVYQGNEASLTTLHNLINGTDDKVLDTEGTLVDFTFAQLKEASIAEAQDSAQGAGEPVEAPTEVTDSATDLTIANAGMTELEDTTTIAVRTNGISQDDNELVSAPEQTSTTAESANAVAESNWNPEASMTTDASGTAEEWVQVPRDPAETETGVAATPAAIVAESSWAEEVATSAEEQKKENDGFEQVRGRHGEHRGRGRGGRGGRGEFRGRGRGGAGRGSGEGRGRGGGNPTRGPRGGPREGRGDRS